jgi:hypothetical protein
MKTAYQLEPPINRLKKAKVPEAINSINPKKSSSSDLTLTQLFDGVLLKGYFPAQWKIALIILILKPGKPPNE